MASSLPNSPSSAPAPRLTPAELTEAVSAALAAEANPDNAGPMAAYLKDQFAFFGVKAPERRAIQRRVVAESEWGSPSAEELMAFARACWGEPERELQYAAMDLLRRHARLLEPAHLDGLRGLITTKSWWDTVDSLAVHTVGPLVAAHPELGATMDIWINDDNIWVARTAILHQLSYKEGTDRTRLFRYVDLRAADTEFFIRKALGWALRQYARTEPEAVLTFVTERESTLSGLTRREALKHLNRR